MRLIDADAIRDEWLYESGTFEPKDVLDSIDCQPTVDAVPVVRCRECRWACLAPQRQTATCMKNRLPFTHDYDWFCADGERRSE